MIVVINPSSASGHSFKGLDAYCSHDQGQSSSAERVDWIDSRNLATNDSAQAWKIMAATAQSQAALKSAAGVRAGRPTKDGPVMHVVLSFVDGEPTTRKAMAAAADEFLENLGVDPAKMRAKNKPKRRQFANEHQVMMYAHSDTKNRHLHLMINKVHPETGVNLPSNNDRLKAQKWALDYSKRYGTDTKTPAREENARDRKAGEYVKATRRKSRNVYEFDKQADSLANDNTAKKQLETLRQKDAALALRGRNLALLQHNRENKVFDAYEQRKTAIGRSLQQKINKSKAALRETYRPRWRALTTQQANEKRTFDMLESTLFGKAGNILKTVKLSADLIHDQKTNVIRRSFRILTNAGDRKAYFEQAQERVKSALQREQRVELSQAKETLKASHGDKLAQSRQVFNQDRSGLLKRHQTENHELQMTWRDRHQDKAKQLEKLVQREKLLTDYGQAATPTRSAAATDESRSLADKYKQALLDDYRSSAYDRAPANDNERDDGNER